MRRRESPFKILSTLETALNALHEDRAAGPVACRAAYRLAHYADAQYRAVQAQRDSPEHATTQAIIKLKRQQVWLRLACWHSK